MKDYTENDGMTPESQQIIDIVEQLPAWERERLVNAVRQIAEVYCAGRHTTLRPATSTQNDSQPPANVVSLQSWRARVG